MFAQETPTILPPGVWTPRVVEAFPAMHEHPYRSQIFDLLRAAEKDIFEPFLMLSSPASFGQQFEFLALKYAPIRIQALLWFAHGVGMDLEFFRKYFDATREVGIWVVDNSWGLPRAELADTFDRYLTTSQLMLNTAPKLVELTGHDIVGAFRSITELDFGLTSLTFAFEKEIKTVGWVVSETFSRTRRALLEYEQAVTLLASQAEEAERMEKVLSALRPESGVEQPTERDLRSDYRKYSIPG